MAYQIGRLEIAGVVFLFLLLYVCTFLLSFCELTFYSLIHITLFAFACADLQRNKLAAALEAEEGFDMEYRKDIEQRSQAS